MSQEVVEGAEFRLVRDEEQGLYYVQVGVDGAFRSFASMKLGKLDQLRERALEAKSQQTTPTFQQ